MLTESHTLRLTERVRGCNWMTHQHILHNQLVRKDLVNQYCYNLPHEDKGGCVVFLGAINESPNKNSNTCASSYVTLLHSQR